MFRCRFILIDYTIIDVLSGDLIFILTSFFFQNTSVRHLPGYGPAVPQECTDCGRKFIMGGPIWSAPIHDQEWVASIIEDVNRMKSSYPAYEHISAILNTISEVCVFLQGLFI